MVDYSHQCEAPNLGILAVRYPVGMLQAKSMITKRGGSVWRESPACHSVKSVTSISFLLKRPMARLCSFSPLRNEELIALPGRLASFAVPMRAFA